METAEVTLRVATPRDAAAIAGLHADSWRRHYRGAYDDAYLDGPVFEDRKAVWTERLTDTSRTGTTTVVAEHDATVIGFAHIMFDADPAWGSLLDNLHVTAERKRDGVGTALLRASARAVVARPAPGGLYLWVLEQNTAAQAFYRARGGTPVERALRGPFPGGGTAFAFRYAWPDPVSVDMSRQEG